MDNILLQASCLSSVSSFLTAPYTAWFPIAVLVTFTVIAVLAIVYMFAPLMGREDIRKNVEIMIYQAVFSLALIVLFGAFSTWICTMNAESPLNSIGLFPSNSLFTNIVEPSEGTLYETALYDIYLFTNGALANANNLLFTFLVGINIGPQFTISINFIPGVPGLGVGDKVPFAISGLLGSFPQYAIDALSWLFIFNDLQFIVISAAPIIFAILVGLGLISRVFEVTRSFGGALIALGVGVGFLYPLMVSITYGFIDVAYNNLYNNVLENTVSCTLGTNTNWQTIAESILLGGAIVDFILCYFYSFINMVGFILTATLILPILNLVVVETFVLDFSAAFGERMSFMSLLSKMV